jgi:hypothetical protein
MIILVAKDEHRALKAHYGRRRQNVNTFFTNCLCYKLLWLSSSVAQSLRGASPYRPPRGLGAKPAREAAGRDQGRPRGKIHRNWRA